MFDIGWTELMLIGVVALVVVGPKELPEMFRTMGRVTAKARMMARDFQRAMEDAADQTGLKDVSRDLQRTSAAVSSPIRTGLDAVNRRLDDMDKPKGPTPSVPSPAPVPQAPVVAADPVIAATSATPAASVVLPPEPAATTIQAAEAVAPVAKPKTAKPRKPKAAVDAAAPKTPKPRKKAKAAAAPAVPDDAAGEETKA